MSRLVKSSGLPLLAVALFGLFAPEVCEAQRAQVMGQVKGVDGKPLKGAVIHIDDTQTVRKFTVKTNKKGRYFHGAIPLGYYRVSVQVNGTEMHAVPNVRIYRTKRPGDTTSYDAEPVKVDFDLQVIAKLKKRRQEALAKRSAAEIAADRAKEEERKFGHMNEEFRKGREHFHARRFRQALQAYVRAAEMDPRQHIIFAEMGEANRALRKYDDAINSYRKALTVLAQNPDSKVGAKYQMNLGLLYGLMDQTDQALAAIKEALELNPGDASLAYFNLGATLVNSGRNEGAITAFKKAIEANPDHANSQYQLGVCLLGMATVDEQGRSIPPPGTLEAFKKYVELEPSGPYASEANSMIQALAAQVKTTFDAKKDK